MTARDLQDAIKSGNIVGIHRALGEPGATTEEHGGYETLPVFTAYEYKQFASLTLLLEKGANVNSKDIWGRSLLHLAILDENIPVMRLLINHGANINAKNDTGDTPLHYAVESDPPEPIVTLLLKLGVDPTIKNNAGVTPKFVAQYLERRSICVLLDKFSTISPSEHTPSRRS